MATCSNSKRGTSSGGETGDIPIAENYGDSLVGKFVTNLYEFKLYDQPEGKVNIDSDEKGIEGRRGIFGGKCIIK